jgi:hypothetical protein
MRRTAWLLAACGIIWGAGGCGGDDGPTNPGGGSLTAPPLRDGTWTLTQVSYSYGSPLCETDTVVVEEDQILCGATIETIHGFEDLSGQGVDCSVGGIGNTFTVDCSGTLEQDPCTITFEITGEGSNTETSFSMYLDLVIGATGPADPCGAFEIPCVTRIEMTGTWVSEDGACGSAAAPTDLSRFTVPALERILAGN